MYIYGRSYHGVYRHDRIIQDVVLHLRSDPLNMIRSKLMMLDSTGRSSGLVLRSEQSGKGGVEPIRPFDGRYGGVTNEKTLRVVAVC